MAADVIKRFVIGLGADNKQLVKGLGEADKSISDFVSRAKGILAGLGVGAGFAKLVTDFADIGDRLKQFSDSTGIAVEDVSRLGLALEKFGGDTNEAAATLENLQDSIRQAKDWGQGPLMDVMRRYGVDLRNGNKQIKTATELYYDLADIMQGMSKDRQRDLAQSLGLDEASIKFLQQGRKGVDEMLSSVSDMAVMTEADAAASREWKKTLTDLRQSLVGFGRQIARAVMPVIQKFTDWAKKITTYFNENRQVIDHVANVIKNNLGPAFAIAAAMIGKSMAGLMIKLAPLTAIALLIDDIAVFMSNSGGKSVIGTLLGDKGDAVRETIAKIFGSIGGILSKVLTGDFKGAFEEVKALWNEILVPLAKDLGSWVWQGFANTFPRLAELFKGLWQDVCSLFVAIWNGEWNKAWESLKSGYMNYLNIFKELGLMLVDTIIYGLQKIPALKSLIGDYQFKSDYYQDLTGQNKKPSANNLLSGQNQLRNLSNMFNNIQNITVNVVSNGDVDPKTVQNAARQGAEQGAGGVVKAVAATQGGY